MSSWWIPGIRISLFLEADVPSYSYQAGLGQAYDPDSCLGLGVSTSVEVSQAVVQPQEVVPRAVF